MNYQTVFDVTIAGYKSFSHLNVGLIILAVGSLILILNEKTEIAKLFPFWTKSRLRIWAIIYVSFAAFWFVTVLWHTSVDYLRLKNALVNNQCELVEGKVAQFVPMPASGHAMESFSVNGHFFQYSDYDITAGFNNTQSHGGPIKLGQQVRIHCLGNEIAKLEIAQ